jgi:hypothetical protein
MNQQINIENQNIHLFIQKIYSFIGKTNEGFLKQDYYNAYGRICLFSDCLLTVPALLEPTKQ